jgi:hypothetical protein
MTGDIKPSLLDGVSEALGEKDATEDAATPGKLPTTPAGVFAPPPGGWAGVFASLSGLLTRSTHPQQQRTVWHRESRMAPNIPMMSVVAPPRIARMSAVLLTTLPIAALSSLRKMPPAYFFVPARVVQCCFVPPGQSAHSEIYYTPNIFLFSKGHSKNLVWHPKLSFERHKVIMHT